MNTLSNPIVRLLLCGAVNLAFALNAHGQGQSIIQFANLATGVNAPFFAADGMTRLDGERYVAALYAAPVGSAEEALTLAGPPRPFRSGINAGYWLSANLALPFPAGSQVLLQVRFWDTESGVHPTFEQAEAAGAEVGISELFVLTLNPPTPTAMVGLRSASLVPTLTLSRGIPNVSTDASAVNKGTQLTNLCGVPVGLNRWFRVTSRSAGEAVLTTTGSAIDTVMTAFTGSVANPASLVALACNDDRSTNETVSEARFSVETDKLYLVCIAGKNGTSGIVRFNYSLATWLGMRPLSQTQIELSWPADATNFVLEATQTPTGMSSWLRITNAPAVTTNTKTISVETSEPRNFYRLRLDAPP